LPRSAVVFGQYEQLDLSYALEVFNTYPNKFRVVTPVDATDPAIDDVVAKWAATPGARGIRIRIRDGLPMDADHPGLNRAFAAAARHGLPVNLLCWGILDKGLPHIQRYRPSGPAAAWQCLIDSGYLLLEDLKRIIAQSARRWDLLASAPESAAAQ
jgi:hypothetical protein